MVYSEPWHVKILLYSESWYIQNLTNIYDEVFWENSCNGYNFFLQYQLFTFSTLWKLNRNFYSTVLTFTPEIFHRCKQVLSLRKPGTANCSYTYSLMYSSKLAYLQLITVLVYGSSPLKNQEQIYKELLAKSLKITWKWIPFSSLQFY